MTPFMELLIVLRSSERDKHATFGRQNENRVYPISMSEQSYYSERSPILRVFGHHCARMTTLLRIRPSLLDRVAFAPRTAIHAIAAFLYLAPQAGRPDPTVAALLENDDPRDLLRQAIPNAPDRLYRALNRAGDRVLERSFYARLRDLCGSPLAEPLLAGGPLNNVRLGRAEAVLTMDPSLVSLPWVLGVGTSQLESVDAIITLLRDHRAFADDALHLPKGAGLPALLKRLHRALDWLEAPEPGFAVSSPYRIIRNVRELREVGSIFKNCVRLHAHGHWYRLVSGSSVYVASDALLAALGRHGNLWTVDEVRGPNNESVSADQKADLIAALKAAGVRILRCDPTHALSAMEYATSIEDCEDDFC
jgi:hypothetical protein